MKIKITFFICFIAIFLMNAQEEQQFVEITGPVYKPKRMIKKIIEDLSKEPKCFESDNPFAPRYHYLSFSFHEDTGDYYLITMSSSNFISEYVIEVIDFHFSGIFYYKEYIVLLDFENDKTENRKKFFKKTTKKLKIKVPVTDNFEPYCGSDFELEGGNFKFTDKVESWNIITY